MPEFYGAQGHCPDEPYLVTALIDATGLAPAYLVAVTTLVGLLGLMKAKETRIQRCGLGKAGHRRRV
ncbi:hypothetical protein [Nocardia sp. NPDC004711]